MRVSAALLQRMKRDSLRSVRQGVTEAAKPVSTHNTLTALPYSPPPPPPALPCNLIGLSTGATATAAATLHCTETDRYVPLWTHMPQLLCYHASNGDLNTQNPVTDWLTKVAN